MVNGYTSEGDYLSKIINIFQGLFGAPLNLKKRLVYMGLQTQKITPSEKMVENLPGVILTFQITGIKVIDAREFLDPLPFCKGGVVL